MKPFPYPHLNIGTDIVHLPRISRLLGKRPNYLEKFTRRILCESEQEDFRRRFLTSNTGMNRDKSNNGVQYKITSSERSSSSRSKLKPKEDTTTTTTTQTEPESKSESKSEITDITRWLAGRFAAKEAARKAAPLGATSLGWKDVLVRVPPPQPPSPSQQPRQPIQRGDGDDGTTSTQSGTKSPRGQGGGRPEIVYLGQDNDHDHNTTNNNNNQQQDGVECSDSYHADDDQIGRLSISHDGEYVIATVLAVG